MTRSCTRALLVLLVFLVWTPQAESQSFGALRRVLLRKYSPKTHGTALKAARAISQHASTATLRFVIERIKSLSREIDEYQRDHERLVREEKELAAKVAKARSRGAGSINRSDVEDLQIMRTTMQQQLRVMGDLEDLVDALRRAVGRIVPKLEGRDRESGFKSIVNACRRSRNDFDKLVLLKTLIYCDQQYVSDYLNKLVLSKDELDRLRALVAAEEWGGLRAMRLALVCLEDPVWTVRAQAIRILKTVGGKRAADFLVAVLKREKERLRTDAVIALRRVTGVNFHRNAYLWERWLKENGSRLPRPSETANAPPLPKPEKKEKETAKEGSPKSRPAALRTGFYGIRSTSKHIVFVLDFSGSMAYAKPGTGGKNEKTQYGPININGRRRIDHLGSELLRAVAGLPKSATFNIVTFASEVKVWQPRMVFATLENKKALKAWLTKQRPGGGTNLFGGIEEAFKYAGRGSFDKAYAVAADTIFVLSDGSPSLGRYQKTKDILAAVRKINSLRRIAVHGVALGTGSGRLLALLARENDGQFVQIPD